MSTFDGIVEEFPDIRIDYFRSHPKQRQPTACFLSHVHSDHLLGLDTLKMPFVYCSAATRRILLKMEKYPHRINFSKGILESRKQTYKHLKLILRPLPPQTATEIELGPNHRIRVTLFDANHCPGAVMFLIEGDDRAILYTGDIRAEPWWVNSLIRSPAMIPYASGHKQLDCLYLDATFASHADIHKHFPTKAEGLAELLEKVSRCPKDSVFYFRAWTLGYEDVWKLLGNTLNSQIHVDQYQIRLFSGVAEDGPNTDAASLVGFQLGNSTQPGCLTTSSTARIHSCEPGLPCHVDLKRNKNVVWISPIISRMDNGTEVTEIGAGGGGGDLYKNSTFEDTTILYSLRGLCSQLATDPESAAHLEHALTAIQKSNLQFNDLGLDPDGDITIKEFMRILAKHEKRQEGLRKYMKATPDVIRFPYSRHSSYNELRHLVEQLKPADVCPCTVDLETWNEGVSMASLFGDLCSDNVFRYDKQIREQVAKRQNSTTTATASDLDSQRTPTPGVVSQEQHANQVSKSGHHGEEQNEDDGYQSQRHLNRNPSPAQQPAQKSLKRPATNLDVNPRPRIQHQSHSFPPSQRAGPSRTAPVHHALQSALETQTSARSDPEYHAFMSRPVPTESQNLRLRLNLQRQWRELNNGHDTMQDPTDTHTNARADHAIHTPVEQIVDVTRESESWNWNETVRRKLFSDAELEHERTNEATMSSIQVDGAVDLKGPILNVDNQLPDDEDESSEMYGIPKLSHQRDLNHCVEHPAIGPRHQEKPQEPELPQPMTRAKFYAEHHDTSDWLSPSNFNDRQQEAYLAAKRALNDDNDYNWEHMGVWSMGYQGHSKVEAEL